MHQTTFANSWSDRQWHGDGANPVAFPCAANALGVTQGWPRHGHTCLQFFFRQSTVRGSTEQRQVDSFTLNPYRKWSDKLPPRYVAELRQTRTFKTDAERQDVVRSDGTFRCHILNKWISEYYLSRYSKIDATRGDASKRRHNYNSWV